jgi:hypothetical protein
MALCFTEGLPRSLDSTAFGLILYFSFRPLISAILIGTHVYLFHPFVGHVLVVIIAQSGPVMMAILWIALKTLTIGQLAALTLPLIVTSWISGWLGLYSPDLPIRRWIINGIRSGAAVYLLSFASGFMISFSINLMNYQRVLEDGGNITKQVLPVLFNGIAYPIAKLSRYIFVQSEKAKNDDVSILGYSII